MELDQAALPRHLSLATPLVGGTVLPTPMPGTVCRLRCVLACFRLPGPRPWPLPADVAGRRALMHSHIGGLVVSRSPEGCRVQALPGGPGGAASCATVITRRNPHGRTAATQQARTILVTTEGADPLLCSFRTSGWTHRPHVTVSAQGAQASRTVHMPHCTQRSLVIWLPCDCRWAPGCGH